MSKPTIPDGAKHCQDCGAVGHLVKNRYYHIAGTTFRTRKCPKCDGLWDTKEVIVVRKPKPL